MPCVFPFRIVPRDSKIVMYGAGKLGKEFYMQIHDTNWCEVIAWIDKGFEGYELSKPFDYVDNIRIYNPDYYVIAVIDMEIGREIKEWLIKIGVEEKKIVWSPGEYRKNYEIFPVDKRLFLNKLKDFIDMAYSYYDTDSIFGGKYLPKFYESNMSLGLRGLRNTEERLNIYKVRGFLRNDDRVLDVGCNSGFFALQISPYVKEVVGYEIESDQIEVAKKAAKLMAVENVRFICGDFREVDEEGKYNAIFLLAVHGHIISDSYTDDMLVKKVIGSLSKGGYLFFESQYGVDKMYWDLSERFQKEGMSVVHRGNYMNLGGNEERDFIVLQN